MADFRQAPLWPEPGDEQRLPGVVTVIDFETTGLEREARATEVGVIALGDDLQPVARFATLLCPPIPPGEGALRVSGLTLAQLATAPAFEEVWPLLHPFISGRVLVAHNADFDENILRNELAAMSLWHGRFATVCTLQGAEGALPGLASYRLGALVSALGLPEYGAHTALEDCQAALALMTYLYERSPHFAAKFQRSSHRAPVFPHPTGTAAMPQPRDA